jgi:hypothetical protein
MAKACSSFQTGERNFYEIVIFLTPIYLPTPYSKKDIFLYIDIGLVQQPDKIVARYALTIYPYSLEEYDVEPEKLRQDIHNFIEKLVEHGLLDASSQ